MARLNRLEHEKLMITLNVHDKNVGVRVNANVRFFLSPYSPCVQGVQRWMKN